MDGGQLFPNREPDHAPRNFSFGGQNEAAGAADAAYGLSSSFVAGVECLHLEGFRADEPASLRNGRHRPSQGQAVPGTLQGHSQLSAAEGISGCGARCRTAALGGHKDKCVDCQYEAPISYNSCRSRCCPKCQAQARRRWLQAQQRDLLYTNYFHVVFTVPHELNPLGLTSRRRLLDLLFEASFQTLLEVAADPKRLGAEIGFLSILHTWSSNLLRHYHIHAAVPAGGLSADHQRWIHTSHPLFLLPVPVLRTVFREKFLAGLRRLYCKGLLKLRGPAAPFSSRVCFEQLMEKLGNKKWCVYAKPPFGGPEHVLRYLGRYTHRMAISNHRIVAFDGERVSFRWRDYAHGGKQRVMTLDAQPTERLQHNPNRIPKALHRNRAFIR